MSDDGYNPVLSPKAKASLEAGILSAKTEPLVYLGSFAQFADDDEEAPQVSQRDLVLAVLAVAEGEHFGATHLHKALFLVGRDRFKFTPGDYGPFCEKLSEILSELIRDRLVFSKGDTKYAATYKGVLKGLEILESLPNEAQVRTWVDWCQKQSFTEIVAAFLTQYPSTFASKSTPLFER